MKVLTAELVATNRRERVSSGVYIEFETTENVKKDDYFSAKRVTLGDYFKVRVGDNNYDFQSNGIKLRQVDENRRYCTL
jgi:hypothetical protein